MIRSHLLFVAASCVTVLSGCSSTEPSQESTEKTENALATQQAAAPTRQRLATGQYVTPTAPRGSVQQFLNPGLAEYPDFVAGEAVRSQLSPDGTVLAVLCAGQNSLYAPDGTVDASNSTQYVFLYDVSGANKRSPVLKQVLRPTNAHVGIVFSRDGNKLYVGGGRDDVVNVFAKSAEVWTAAGTISLNHNKVGIGNGVAPNAGSLALSSDGKTLVVVNNYNDSISIIDTESATVRYEYDLRSFFSGNEGQVGGVGGTFPFAVVVKGNSVAYVTSDRDREVIAVDISSPTQGHLIKRIKLDGNALGVALDANQRRLYVAQDNADQVAVIDTRTHRVIAKIDARAPEGTLPEQHHDTRHTGAGTFGVTLSPDGNTLYAINAGSNSIAVIRIEQSRRNAAPGYEVVGLIPTAYEPHDVTFSADGSWMYIVNGKSVTGPNPEHLTSQTAAITQINYSGGNADAGLAARASNEYQFQLERASLVSAPVPSEGREFDRLTAQVAENNFYAANPEGERVMRFLKKRIKHVIYVIKENRTFDQVLGDLENGANADSSITQFGEAITPNFHRIAKQFVTLDNFRDPGDGSMDGWSWSLQARVTDVEAITQQINYAAVNRGLSYESEGTNRGLPVNYATVAERNAVAGKPGTANYSSSTASLPGGTDNALAGTGNHASSDAPFEQQGGYIFRAVLNAGGTVRNYGVLVNNIGSIGTKDAPISDPYSAGEIQVAPLDPVLAPMTDVYFRGYDQSYPDLWRYTEWKREFDQYVVGGNLPELSLVRLSHDHMGNFSSALAGINTPETQQADDDVSVGLMIQAVAQSRYAADTLFIVVEDDCQDGPDHVDSHRATTYVAGPYVKKGAVVGTYYSQVNAIRTIEDLLGTEHLNLNTAFQPAMIDVFDIRSTPDWTYTAVASTILQATQISTQVTDLGAVYARGPVVNPTHDAAYWAKATVGLDFSDADRVPTGRFNRLLWKGMKGNAPYPHRGEGNAR